jgi:phytoene synthase
MHAHSFEHARLARSDAGTCRALLRDGSHSFFAASLILPKGAREPASALYAFCRLADDAVDRNGGQDALAALRERLQAAYRGRPWPSPVDRAFAHTVARFAIPSALPEALLEGLEWDVCGRRYRTLADLEAYAARVAGSVGAMLAVVMRQGDPDVLARACDLGVAMQLTNIARDVGEDARTGRLYLPLDWLHDAGIDPDNWMARPKFDGALSEVIARVLEAADRLYARADGGIDRLPLLCRPGIRAARLIYAEIGQAVARNNYDSVAYRAVVPTRRKIAIVGRAFAASYFRQICETAPAMEATRFLVTAATRASQPVAHNGSGSAESRISQKLIWVIELFDRLERRRTA